MRRKRIAVTKGQVESFRKLLVGLREKGITIPRVHVQSSYGLFNYPEFTGDYVRVGLAVYGILSSPGDTVRRRLI